MIRRKIAGGLGFPLKDYISGTTTVDTLRFLEESQYWDEERMNDYRLVKLRRIVEYAYRHVPFYKSEFERLKLTPADIRGMSDLEKIPVVTKEVLRERNSEFFASGSRKHIKTGKTGGTTGPPVIIKKDQYDRSFTWASYYRWYGWMGLYLGAKSLTLWGARSVTRYRPADALKNAAINFLLNADVVNSFNMREENLGKLFKKIDRERPALIKGYLSALLFLAGYMDERNLQLSYAPVALSSTTETLLEHNRHFLEKVFRAPLYDQYGCGEVSAIAYECSMHKGLHINQEHVILELLDDNRNPVTHQGNVVVTNLDNMVMPFIRYENGDMASLSEEKCSCGVCQPMLTSVLGRSDENITLKNGARVHGVFFTGILYEKNIGADKIHRFQVYQETPGEIVFRIESPYARDENTDSILNDVLLRYFNKVAIERTKKLPVEPNGKFRYIKLGSKR